MKIGNNELAVPESDKENGLISEAVTPTGDVITQSNTDSNRKDSDENS